MPSIPATSTLQSSSPAQTPSLSADVLLLGLEAVTAKLAPILRSSYRVVVSSSVATARAFLGHNGWAVIVLDLDLSDGAAIDLCRAAKALPKPPSVLVTTAQVERVPDALEARCDGVLLKPFAPNLLVARIGRLIRARSAPTHTGDGTNRFWPTSACAHCDAQGVTSFEFASHRRSWYACLQCKNVWLGKRQE
jgi:DNA-binding response OmpR family regulator